MFCKVDIVVEKRIDAIAIPREIVQTRGNRTVVFVVEQQEARQREVELGIVNRERVEILEGLHEGDLLVIRGYETLKDHTKVKLAESDEDSTESPDQDLSGRPSSS
jgi:multidrug efflux pump subunit AcrA (membrane-fusion protein)